MTTKIIFGFSETANWETRNFLKEKGIESNHERGWLSTFENPDPERLKLVFTGNDTRPAVVALVGTMAFSNLSAEWRWWQNAKRDGVTDPDLPNLEEREDGLYTI